MASELGSEPHSKNKKSFFSNRLNTAAESGTQTCLKTQLSKKKKIFREMILFQLKIVVGGSSRRGKFVVIAVVGVVVGVGVGIGVGVESESELESESESES